MQAPPRLTDRAALLAHRRRARPAALFLHDLARAEVEERLTEVNRTFTRPAVVTPFPEIWTPLLPEARVVPDDPVLHLEEGAHDLVVHALCLHWADDPVGQLVQARRALAPDGFLLAVTFGGRTLADLRAALGVAEVKLRGGLSPRVLPMADIRDLGSLLQRAGLALPVADSFQQTVLYRDLPHLLHELRSMGESNALLARDRRIPPRALFTQAAAAYPTNAEGFLPAVFELVMLSGWAPHPDQPLPLRPGSAAMRLADALKPPDD